MAASRSLNRSLGGAIATIAIVAVLSGIVVVFALRRSHEALEMRRHAHLTIRQLDLFTEAMLEQETGIRGYLLTGRETSLEPYTNGRVIFDAVVPTLRAAMRDTPEEAELFQAVVAAARAWQTEIADVVVRDMAEPATRPTAYALESTGAGKRYFDAFRGKLRTIEQAELRTADAQNIVSGEWQKRVALSIWAAAAVILVICAIVALAINRSIARPLDDLADAMRRLVERDLEVVVPGTELRSEVGAMARAVQVFKDGLIELDRTSLLRVTADTLPALVGYIDARRRVGFLNGEFARWFGLNAEDAPRATGRPLASVFPDGSFPGGDGPLTAALAGIETRFEHTFVHSEIGPRELSAFYRPHRSPAGTVLGVVTLLTDITERKEEEAALAAAKDSAEAANRAKSTFLANMSHELRTPLSAVIGYSEMLEEEAEETGATAILNDLGKIKTNAKHLLGLINDVLDLSKIEANKMEVIVESIDVAAFVRDASETVDALIARKGNRLILDIDAAAGTMRTDSVKLRQCLFNLLSNAAKFTEKGSITLRVMRDAAPNGDWLSFAVRDTGIGMTPEQLSRLFQRFSQADETTTRKFGGTGLGLALSQGFARLLGGDISVESALGEGTCFTLRLPAVPPEGAAALETPDQAAPPAGHERGDLVLVIDDEPSHRDLMSRFLQRQGFTVRAAADGRSGLAIARALAPRAILLDVMMPGMDGWDVLNALKADAATAGIPVVMVSFVADAAISASLGAADTLPKPVDWTRLRTILDGLRTEPGGDVLVVDDDADTRDRLRSVLEKNGWSVREAADGAAALERVADAAPHLIVLDLTMPVMDGFSFLHRLRQLPAHADIPVVVLSARDISAADRERLKEADQILSKGETSMRDLTAELRRLEERA